MKKMLSNLTDLVLVGQEKVNYQLYSGWIPYSHLHSHSQLTESSYRLAGEVDLYEVPKDATVCTIDTFAYRARHQTDTKIKRIKTGNFQGDQNGKLRSLKLSAVIVERDLFIIVVQANPKVIDIAPKAPMRVSGMSALHNAIRQARRRFSSEKQEEKSA